MKITDKVKIGSIEYQVNKVSRPCKGNTNVDGEIIYSEGTIALRSGNDDCQDYNDYVFIHEIMHGIFNHMCIEQDEGLVEKISKGLHQVVKDNPQIFEVIK